VKRLIVNADDFGLTPGINAAIVELNHAGALRSATLMAAAPHFRPAVELALGRTTLAVGCHVVLTDGIPVLSPSEIPSLIDPVNPGSGQFRPNLRGFLSDLLRGRIREEEIEAETGAQIARIQSAGLSVSHLDTHKHTHIFPGVLRPLLRAARRLGATAVRNPFEPLWSLRATPGARMPRRLAVYGFQSLRRPFSRLIRQNGMATTGGTIGMLATGILDGCALHALLRSMPEGVWELVCHPGYRDDALEQTRTRLRASREIERQALLEVIPQAIHADRDLELADFRQTSC
jgi:predicted glycoside hydrolase/deacetylase ChbG (UPF0249 family)